MGDKETHTVYFYNLDNGRDPAQVNKEIRALCNMDAPPEKRPGLVGLCEAKGYSLPALDGFHLVRDQSTAPRANVAAYVQEPYWAGFTKWLDLEFTWPRTSNPGTHEPRSFPVFQMGDIQVIVVHQPPQNCQNSQDGQAEGIDALTDTMKPGPDANDYQTDRPRLALGDFNRRKSEGGPGPSKLAGNIGGNVWGGKIDCLVKRGHGSIADVEYPAKIHGVALKSDHGHCYRTQLTCGYWRA
jgi:hypothetical protein